jgi:hypothetical protein
MYFQILKFIGPSLLLPSLHLTPLSIFISFFRLRIEPEVSLHHKVPLCIEPFSSKTKKRPHKISVCSNDAVFLFIHAHHSFLHIILCRRKNAHKTHSTSMPMYIIGCIYLLLLDFYTVTQKYISFMLLCLAVLYSETCSTIASVELLHTGFYMNFILSTSSPCPFSC